MTTLNVQVNATERDAYQYGGSPGNTWNDWGFHELGVTAFQERHSGQIFEGTSAISGQTIDSGTIQFRSNGNHPTADLFEGDFSCEDVDSPADYPDSTPTNGIISRTRTTNQVSHDEVDFGTWSAAWFAYDVLGGVGSPLQEIADNRLCTKVGVMWIASNAVGSKRQYTSYEGLAANAPKLDIDYSAGAGGAPGPRFFGTSQAGFGCVGGIEFGG